MNTPSERNLDSRRRREQVTLDGELDRFLRRKVNEAARALPRVTRGTPVKASLRLR